MCVIQEGVAHHQTSSKGGQDILGGVTEDVERTKGKPKAFLGEVTQDRHMMPGDLATVRGSPHCILRGGYISFLLVSLL